ncbi:MAG: 16S rRNA (adenine(1518)-N(6)/adenine(1519)-N(6)) -dimethyltransferase RsmA [Desulfobulbaceae bacterium]
MTYEKTKKILRDQGLAPHKRLGQNFLIHRHTAERIVELAGVSPEDTILEVGVGLGALTAPLAGRAKKVIGVEADSGIIRWHREQDDLPANVSLIHGDILKIDLEELAGQAEGSLKIVANLPYSISSPFLFRLIDHRDLVRWAVVMLQKEVAQRLTARPGTKEYGVPSVLLAGCATVEPLLTVKPGEFHPRPKVDSMVVRITFQPVPRHLVELPPFDRELLRRVVNCCFAKRRKTLLNGLAGGGFDIDRKGLTEIIRAAGLSPSVRAEQLGFEQFVALTISLSRYR